ncbi:DUF6529 family protein [Actinoplanes sp. NEAU-A12]|uniref:DUF6529 family protein n=1 Tax=Actinoplanes sandaracinus TaxID=3045177 RepID=A0ABT6WYP0_9ACTN|nr:DUF6529 family protein [Actinoplanes sandaracinus]MDI6104794.1 DUF6529 family protein [Actinoplanes sandaracinus]
MTAPPHARSSPSLSDAAKLLIPVAIGSAVAVTLGVYASLHRPTGVAVTMLGVSSPLAVKAWLASASALLGAFQLATASAMYGQLPRVTAPPWTGTAHRWSGRIAFLLSIPVAVHCLYALGLQSSSPRVLLHSLLGCLFYGAFTVKMLFLTKQGLTGWALPTAGGIVFAALTALWLTSSLWFFTAAP